MVHPDYQYTPKLHPGDGLADRRRRVRRACSASRILGRSALRGGMPLYKYVANRFLTLVENLLLRREALRVPHRLPRLLARVLERCRSRRTPTTSSSTTRCWPRSSTSASTIGEVSLPDAVLRRGVVDQLPPAQRPTAWDACGPPSSSRWRDGEGPARRSSGGTTINWSHAHASRTPRGLPLSLDPEARSAHELRRKSRLSRRANVVATPRRPPSDRVPEVLAVAVAVLAAGLLAHLDPPLPDLALVARRRHLRRGLAGLEHGVLPYRDIVIFNFPGQHLPPLVRRQGLRLGPHRADLRGRCRAAGRPGDLCWWAGVVGGSAGSLPGLVGFVAALEVYLNLDYSQVFQRDWQGPALVALAMMGAQAVPNRWGRLGSALAFAAGVSVRPHAVLFLPALVLALDDGARPSDGPPIRPSARCSSGGWPSSRSCAGDGPAARLRILDDLLRHLGTIKHRPLYARVSWGDSWRVFRDQYSDGRVALGSVATLLLAIRSGATARRAPPPGSRPCSWPRPTSRSTRSSTPTSSYPSSCSGP